MCHPLHGLWVPGVKSPAFGILESQECRVTGLGTGYIVRYGAAPGLCGQVPQWMPGTHLPSSLFFVAKDGSQHGILGSTPVLE